ncbi:nibrin [Drosophila miranda]|uniref:nibrin n=1 Tax=Drosophila miranda TaxID=7229 RepID=UPI0007E7E980|nr:nibrin [Drosophila miranda]
MFFLTKEDEKFVLLPNKPVYTVGRLSTDLILLEDLSISRTHVRLHLPSEKDGELQIEDVGSKYGTFLNNDIPRNKRMATNTLTPLPVGFRVRFGATTNIWQVRQMELVTTASALTHAQVFELTELIGSMGGSVVPNWTDECSYLTMNEATVTVKLLHALLENKPIVTFAFWRKLLAAANSIHVREGWPQPKDYQPTNLDLTWRPERTTLFAEKTFVFMNRRHFEIYGAVVRKAGATCKDLNSGVRKTFLTKKDVIVIQYVPSTQSQSTETINSIQDILEQSGLRIIQEYEIGMALLHCSTKEFCNPSHKLIGDSMTTTESMTSSFHCSVLVANTERSESTAGPVSELVVPESDVYKMEPESDKPETEPTVPKSSQQKRCRQIIVDSSDEEQEKTKKKRSMELPSEKPKPRNKNAILVDSSDEEQTEKPPARARPKSRVILVDSSDEENNISSKPTAATRQSTRGKENSENVDNNKEPEKKSESPRRSSRNQAKATLPVAVESDEDDFPLFQFKKNLQKEQPQKPAETSVLPNSAEKTANPPARIRVINFLEKSQPQKTAPQASQSRSQSQTQPRKRLRLDLINESDSDDGDHLFKFSDSKKKMKKAEEHANEDSNDGLFNFHSQNQSEEDDQNQDNVLTEPFRPEVIDKPKSKYVVVQPKGLPRKVDISGWLSCSRLHDEVKPEPNVSGNMEAAPVGDEVNLEQSIKQDPDADEAHTKWLASIQDSIQVRLCAMNITARPHDDVDAAPDDSVSKYKGRKNFKKFVKKTNPHPHQQVLSLKRLQLADGIASCL